MTGVILQTAVHFALISAWTIVRNSRGSIAQDFTIVKARCSAFSMTLRAETREMRVRDETSLGTATTNLRMHAHLACAADFLLADACRPA